jgi:hypothetical protein
VTETLASQQSTEVGRWSRLRSPLLTIGGLAATTLALHVRDPHSQYSWGLCPSAAMGLSCPGCGGLRAVNDLTNGDVAAAASSNLLFVVALPFAVVVLALWAFDSWRGTPPTIPWPRLKPLVPVLLVAVLAFTVARNLSVGAWLAP